MAESNTRETALAEHLPALTPQEAAVEANRCLFCYDAPCTHACPTHIDVPRFIKKIATGNLIGSAKTILEANLLGATCARVCPVEELCVGACVLGAEHKPIAIGRLQRFSTDQVEGKDIFSPGPATGKKIAVIGAGPAGLSCAGQLARLGHAVTIYEKRALGGGLSTYGIIALREPVDASLREVDMIRRLGVGIEYGRELGRDLELTTLRAGFDAVFIGAGLGSTPAMEIEGEEHVLDGLAYIEESKVALDTMRVGRSVVVVGAGNTAIDCATIARRLGAEHVTMVYRRTEREMTAYKHERDFVRLEGVAIEFLMQPVRVLAIDGAVTGLECVRMKLGAPDASGRRAPRPIAGSEVILDADQIVKAIGQVKHPLGELATRNGFIAVNDAFETSLPGVYSGGDCIRATGSASTVMAVQDGKLAAQSIHRSLTHD